MNDARMYDILWLMLCSALVLTMQGGFCLLECGLVRAKNSINVAFKNMVDLCLSSLGFWLVGFGLMFGASYAGVIGTDRFAPGADAGTWPLAFLVFQMVFCSTATTIVSGAVSERMRFNAYLLIAVVVSVAIYPLVGHWAWAGADVGEARGWLNSRGFIDFAGSTVVHSVGGWISLAAVIVIGPRIGRFDQQGPGIHGHSLSTAAFGTMLLWFGWLGFNGGSTLGVSDAIPRILVNTNLAAAAGGVGALGLSLVIFGKPDVGQVLNGCLAGLVGITASCHLQTPAASLLIGATSAGVCVLGTLLLERLRIDDVVSASPVHAMAGAWGTLCVALFAPDGSWGTGLTRWEQLGVQAMGVGACFALAFGGGFVLLWSINRVWPLRVSAEQERMGLNVAEHGASSELLDLLQDMDTHRQGGDFARRVRVEPHTEVGQIAAEYNRVLDTVTHEMRTREATAEALRVAEERYRSIFENAIEGIFQTSPEGRYLAANPALARIYGYASSAELIDSVSQIARQVYVDPKRRDQFVELMRRNGEVKRFESEVYRKDGSRCWISENARAVYDDHGILLYYEGTVEDITERRQTEKMLRLTQFSIDAASDYIFWVGADGRFLYANDAALHAYGYKLEEMLRMHVWNISRSRTDVTRWKEYWEQVKQLGSTLIETVHYDKDGREFPVELAGTYVNFHGEEYVFAYGRDITERKAQEQAHKDKEAAEAASRAKSDFLANMSHEIRTPLNGVIGMIELLMATQMDAKQQRYARIAKSSADSLLSLINDILDFSKIEAGKLELDRVPFDLPVLVEDVVEMFAQRAASKGIELFTHAQPGVPARVIGDPDRLRQVLINLINNAIKFTESGEVVVRAESAHVDGDGGAVVRFEVSDTGIGIPEERRNRLFRPFSQVDASTTRRFGGTGLGLAICKQLVELMGGEIGVESVVHRGSTFWFTVRLGVDSSERPAASPAESLRGMRVLVVDDNATNREILEEQMGNWGCLVVCAESANEGLKRMEEAHGRGEPFRLAVVDMQMPEVDGLELVRRIRSDSRYASTLILILSSIGDQVDAAQLRRGDVAGLLTKPVRQSRLYDTIVEVLHATHRPTAAAVSDPAPPAWTQRERRDVSVLLAEDNDVNQVVAAELLRKAGIRCEIVGNGRQAVEALRRQAYDLVLMDCQMPEMDGFEATRAIREAEKGGDIKPKRGDRTPIIALTANAVKGDREVCLSAGMDGYITKPINPTELLAVIDEWTAEVPASPPTPAGEATRMESPIALQELVTRCMDDQALALTLLDKYAKGVSDTVSAIEDAIASADAESLLRQAHLLKGTSSNIAAAAVSRIAAEIEALARDRRVDEAAQRLDQLKKDVDECVAYITRLSLKLGETHQRR